MPVKEVPIKKKGGGERKLGIPTLLDRIAQQVVKTHLERIVEPLFHNSSFGYRPDRNCHQAVAQANKNTVSNDFVIDMDIKGFFDNIDHDLLMKAVRFYCGDKWVLLYVERWLKSGIVQQDGMHIDRLTGTPQGGVISPLLANIFMHVCFCPIIQGIINYYCKFSSNHTREIWNKLNTRLLKWVKWEKGLYKKASARWLKKKYKEAPLLFPHWKLVYP